MNIDNELIVLSDDSDEEIRYQTSLFKTKQSNTSNSKNTKSRENDLTWNDFPQVDFGTEDIADDYSKTKISDAYRLAELHFPPEKDNNKFQDVRTLTSDDSDYETEKVPFQSQNHALNSENLSSDDSINEVPTKDKKTKGRKREPKAKKVDEEKQRRQQEKQLARLKKQEETLRQKALKQLKIKNKIDVDPNESMKLMEVIFDNSLVNFDFFIDFLEIAKQRELKYIATSQLIPNSITWKRTVEDHYLDEQNQICQNRKVIDECHVLIIWDCKEILQQVNDNTLVSSISNIKSLMPDKTLTLAIYKIEKYFEYLQKLKYNMMRQEMGLDGGKQKNDFSKYPQVSRKDFEEALIEIQLLFNANCRIIESQAEMALLIQQYTKSMATLPIKLQQRNENSAIDWYANSDNRDTVKVDKDGNGLKRLWQQQLSQFSQVSLEKAESISTHYKSPLQLMEKYAECTPANGEGLLKDIQVRRAAGPLSGTRKIGPELSRKMYIMFTSRDGEALLHE